MNDNKLYFAKFISLISSPVVLSVILIVFLLSRYNSFVYELGMVITIFSVVFLPAYISLLFKKYPGSYSNFLKIDRKERNLLYLALSIGALLNISLFSQEKKLITLMNLNIVLFIFFVVFLIVNS
ncbi:hypothetical protein D6810_01370, partial [Candidatus Dojkabacteria bacterium]